MKPVFSCIVILLVFSSLHQLFLLPGVGEVEVRQEETGAIWPTEWGGAEHRLQSPTGVDDDLGNVMGRFRVEGLSSIIGGAVGPEGTFYATTREGYLMAVDPFSGLLWRSEEPVGANVSGPALDSAGNIYLTSDGRLLSFTPGGQERWSLIATGGAAFSTSPTVTWNGTIYVGDEEGELYCIDTDGEIRWRKRVSDGPIYVPIAVDGRWGNIYVAIHREGVHFLTSAAEEYFFYPVNISASAQIIALKKAIYIAGEKNVSYVSQVVSWTFNVTPELPRSIGLSWARDSLFVPTEASVICLRRRAEVEWIVETLTSENTGSTLLIDRYGTIFVGGHNLTAITSTGEVKYSRRYEGGVIKHLYPGIEGLLYAVDDRDTLVVFGRTRAAAYRGLRAERVEGGLLIRWEHPWGNPNTTYRLSRIEGDGPLVVICNTTGTSFLDVNVTEGIIYRYHLVATVRGYLFVFYNDIEVQLWGGGCWPMMGGNVLHTSQSIFNTSSNSGGFLWRVPVGDGIYSSPVVGTDGTVYAPTGRDLRAFGPGGTPLWNLSLSATSNCIPLIGRDGTIYLTTEDGRLWAVNPSGTLRWSRKVTTQFWAAPTQAPNGTLYVGGFDGYLYALTEEGDLLWKVYTGGAVETYPAVGHNGTIYVANDNGYVVAVSPSGRVYWSYNVGNVTLGGPSVAPDGTICVGVRKLGVVALTPDGVVKWTSEFESGSDTNPSISYNGDIYAGSLDGYLYDISPDGLIRWRYSTGLIIKSDPLIGLNEEIYFASYDGFLYALNPTGNLLWKFRTGSGIFSSPAVDAEGNLYIISWDGYLYAIGGDLPAPPGELHASYYKSYLELTWEARGREDIIAGYRIYRVDSQGEERLVGETTEEHFNDTTATPGGVYTYYVRSVDARGRTSPEASAITVNLSEIIRPPSPPFNLTARVVSGWVNLTWMPPIHDGGVPIVKYVVYRGESGSSLKPVGETEETFYLDDMRGREGVFVYAVMAVNAANKSNVSSTLEVQLSSVPSPPVVVECFLSTSFLHARWLPPEYEGAAPVSHYKVLIYMYLGYEVFNYTTPTNRTNLNLTLPSYLIFPGTEYYIVVHAVNRYGQSPPSEPYRTIAEEEIVILFFRAEREETPDGSWRVRLTWSLSDPSRVSELHLYKYRSGEEYDLQVDSIQLSPFSAYYIDSDIEPGSEYYYRLEVTLEGGRTFTRESNIVTIPHMRPRQIIILVVIVISVIVGISAVAIALFLSMRKVPRRRGWGGYPPPPLAVAPEFQIGGAERGRGPPRWSEE